MERLMEASVGRGCFLEANGQPERFDWKDVHCRMAKEIGLNLALSTDAHAVAQLDHMRLCIDQARRGFLEADDVDNTRSWRVLKRLLRR